MDLFNWAELTFAYYKTDFNVRCYYTNGKWGELEISDSEYMPIHIAATALHYGQQSFEGLKAYKGKDGRVRIFRWEDNAKRMQDSAQGILMAVPPIELFKKMIYEVVKLNIKFVPPYGTGSSLYIRPLLIGTGPRVGVKPSEEFLLLMFVSPVGPYFKSGFAPVSMLITRDYDRAAPLGTGRFKVGGNYAASLTSMKIAHDNGYANVIYLDAKDKKYIDECGPANFFGIKNNSYITPKSTSILPSITNKSLMTLAEELGMKVEQRPVEINELESFEEVGACGTAAVISPIGLIKDDYTGREYNYGNEPGKTCTKLYTKLLAIQYGDEEDKYGWIDFVD